MKTLFGYENVITTYKKSSKNAFRKTVGYDHTHKCRDCKKFIECPTGIRKVYKCRLLDITSKKSEIESNEVACRFYEDGERKYEKK